MKEGKEKKKKKGNYIICGVPHMHTGFEVCVCVGGGRLCSITRYGARDDVIYR